MRLSQKPIRFGSLLAAGFALLSIPVLTINAVTNQFTLSVSVPSNVAAGANLTFTGTCKNISGGGTLGGVSLTYTAKNLRTGKIDAYTGPREVPAYIGYDSHLSGHVTMTTANFGIGKSVTKSVTGKVGSAINGDTVLLSVKCSVGGYTSNLVQRTITVGTTSQPSPAAAIKLPLIFRQKGAITTKLANLTKSQAKSFKNFTIEDVANGAIKFLEPVNLNDEALLKKLKTLDSKLRFGAGGVELDSTEIFELNIAAQVQLYNLNLITEQITIYKDGAPVGAGIEDVVYNSKTKKLKFSVNGFSGYQVVSLITVDEDIKALTQTGSEVRELPLRFRVGDLEADVKVTHNGAPVNASAIDSFGYVTADIKLATGNNTILIEVITAGSQVKSTETLNIEYREPIPAAGGGSITVSTWLALSGAALALAAVGASGYLIYSAIKRRTGVKAELKPSEPV